MQKILVSMPNDLAARFKSLVPNRQRSKTIAELLEAEVRRREKKLADCAKAVERDSQLNREMENWDITLNDGLEDESW